MSNCKKCGVPIIEGKYCSRCESQRMRKMGNVAKFIGVVIFTGARIALGIKKPGQNDKL